MAKPNPKFMTDDEKIKEAADTNLSERLGVWDTTDYMKLDKRISPKEGLSEDTDTSTADTLGALGYTSKDFIKGNSPSLPPLTVQELMDRKEATGKGIDVSGDVMRRYTTNEQGVIPGHELGKVRDAYRDAEIKGRDIAKTIMPERMPAKAPEDRAGHPGRVVHDPWASDPAGPNEAVNTTEARELYEGNADSIAKDNDVSAEEHDVEK